MKGKDFYARATQAAGCTSIRQAQKKFAPQSFRRSELSSTETHSNQWRRYKEGLSAPDVATVKRASRTLKLDLRKEACPTLWQAIDPNWSVRNQVSNLLTDARIAKVSRLYARLSPDGSWNRRMHDLLGCCEKSLMATAWDACEAPTMDSLTGLTVLYRWVARQPRPDAHRAVALALYLVLVSLGPELARRGICDSLFAHYQRYVFTLTEAGSIEDGWREMVRRSMLLCNLVVSKIDQTAQADPWTAAHGFLGSQGPFAGDAAAFVPRFTVG